jgi:Ser/Thr protein kinase RdoA (MazF antagonist)
MTNAADFQGLLPDVMLDAVEKATGRRMTGLATPLPSYVNRVYEIQAEDGERLISKFYRPGRWSREALQDEHDFLADCAADEIPVVAPLKFPDDSTLQEADGIYFTIFPKGLGRQLEINSPKDWLRVGRLLGRVHVAGSRREARARISLHPLKSTGTHVRLLIDGDFISPRLLGEFKDVTSRILDDIKDLFDDAEFIRIHGDCHCGNLLSRPGEGIMVIDFDDMMRGPPVQDFWLLLPDHADKCRRELSLLIRGYEMFRDFDDHTLRLIEPLRTMKIIYYLAWCSIQVDDFKFRSDHPEWGSDAFWQREIGDLHTQFEAIRQTTAFSG